MADEKIIKHPMKDKLEAERLEQLKEINPLEKKRREVRWVIRGIRELKRLDRSENQPPKKRDETRVKAGRIKGEIRRLGRELPKTGDDDMRMEAVVEFEDLLRGEENLEMREQTPMKFVIGEFADALTESLESIISSVEDERYKHGYAETLVGNLRSDSERRRNRSADLLGKIVPKFKDENKKKDIVEKVLAAAAPGAEQYLQTGDRIFDAVSEITRKVPDDDFKEKVIGWFINRIGADERDSGWAKAKGRSWRYPFPTHWITNTSAHTIGDIAFTLKDADRQRKLVSKLEDMLDGREDLERVKTAYAVAQRGQKFEGTVASKEDMDQFVQDFLMITKSGAYIGLCKTLNGMTGSDFKYGHALKLAERIGQVDTDARYEGISLFDGIAFTTKIKEVREKLIVPVVDHVGDPMVKTTFIKHVQRSAKDVQEHASKSLKRLLKKHPELDETVKARIRERLSDEHALLNGHGAEEYGRYVPIGENQELWKGYAERASSRLGDDSNLVRRAAVESLKVVVPGIKNDNVRRDHMHRMLDALTKEKDRDAVGALLAATEKTMASLNPDDSEKERMLEGVEKVLDPDDKRTPSVRELAVYALGRTIMSLDSDDLKANWAWRMAPLRNEDGGGPVPSIIAKIVDNIGDVTLKVRFIDLLKQLDMEEKEKEEGA
ncbi:MAG: hypothetical protein V1921_06735 [Candidatus Altiarchaeota archaeon]